MKRLFISLILLLVALILAYPSINKHQDSVHYHAGFIVYIDGVRQDYSDYKFMNFIACSEHDERLSPEQEQLEKAHLHDGDGDVVHVHRAGAVWGDLFRNIKVELPAGSRLTGFVGGQPFDGILDSPIKPDSSVIIVVGLPTGVDLDTYVSLDRIREVESKSELCGT